VASDIASAVRKAVVANPTIENVVIVGGDDAIPFYRAPDTTSIANQNEYAEQVGGSNALSAAFATSHFLTDDHYGDLDPLPWLDRLYHVTDLAVGRLATAVTTQIDRFIQTGGRTAVGASAIVTGYDFMTDGASEVATALDITRDVDRSLISDTWTASQLTTKLTTNAASIVLSPNAHYDHQYLLAASGDGKEVPADEDIADYTILKEVGLGSVMFTMGCNAGVNVPATYGGTRTEDWTDAAAARLAVFVANGGFGYGDAEAYALSEKLMGYFAANLDAGTAGEAWRLAKQQYFAEQGAYGSYDEKALQEAIFYGLPMYRTDAGAPAANSTPLVPGVDLDRPGDPASVLLGTQRPRFSTEPSSRGSYYAADDGALVVSGYPIQPKLVIDVTPVNPASFEARGAVIEGMISSEGTATDPAFARAIVDLASLEPEVEGDNVIFPSAFQSIGSIGAKNGRKDNLVLIPGQLAKDTTGATQTLLTEIDPRVYYADLTTNVANDRTKPQIVQSDADAGSGVVLFTVTATDLPSGSAPVTGVKRVLVLYNDNNTPNWQPVDLLPVSGSDEWVGALRTNATNGRYFVQVVDGAGNVGISSFKGAFYRASGEGPDAALIIEGTEGENGWYTSPVTVTVVGKASPLPNATVTGYGTTQSGTTVSVDESGRYTATVPVGSAGTISTSFKVDLDDPTITLSPKATILFPGQTMTASNNYACNDIPLGLVSCTPSTQTFSAGTLRRVTAVDAAGRRATSGQAALAASGTYNAVTQWFTSTPTLTLYSTANTASFFPPALGQGTSTVTLTVEGSAASTVVRVDSIRPTVTATTSNPTYNVGDTGTATCSVFDTGSGPNGCSIGTPDTSPLPDNVTSVTRTLTATGRDVAGNVSTVTITYRVVRPLPWRINGFFSPVNMTLTGETLPSNGEGTVVNVVNAGRSVPMKFEVFAPDGTEVTTLSGPGWVIRHSTQAVNRQVQPWIVPLDAPGPALNSSCTDKPEVPLQSNSTKASAIKFDGDQFNLNADTNDSVSSGATNCFKFQVWVESTTNPGVVLAKVTAFFRLAV
jgi:hypothetical protein